MRKAAVCIVCFFPKTEAEIIAVKPGWQSKPRKLVGKLETGHTSGIGRIRSKRRRHQAIGISYQMHGLVCVDKNQQVLRPAIIWCDSRAVPYGQKGFETLGEETCLSHLLNSPATHGLQTGLD